MVGTTSNCVSIERVSKVTFEPDGSRHTKILEAGQFRQNKQQLLESWGSNQQDEFKNRKKSVDWSALGKGEGAQSEVRETAGYFALF